MSRFAVINRTTDDKSAFELGCRWARRDATACPCEGSGETARLARLEEGLVLRYDEAILRRTLHGKIDKNQYQFSRSASGGGFDVGID